MLIVCFGFVVMATTKSANVKQRLTLVESNLNTLALKTDIAAANIEENALGILSLNRTVKELEKCLVNEHDAQLETSDRGRHEACNDRHSRTIVSAFTQEKLHVRKKLRRMSKAIKTIEKEKGLSNKSAASELKATQAEMNEALSLVKEQTRTELNEALSLVKEQTRTELNEALVMADERHRTEMNKVIALAGEIHLHAIEALKQAHQTELSNLKAWVNDTLQNTCKDVDSPTPGADLRCWQDWKKYGTSCYKLYDDKITYEEAKRECSRNRANVVDIKDDLENRFVMSLVKGKHRSWTWISLRYQDSDATWVWERTGKEAIYT